MSSATAGSIVEINGHAVDISGLRPVGTRPPLGDYIRGIWGRRHFIRADARARALSSNRDMLLGNGWLIGRPLLDGFAFFLVFGVMLGTSKGVDNYIAWLLIGVYLFSFTSRSLTEGATAMSAGKNIIRAFAFPRATVPIAIVLRQVISTLPVIMMMLVMIAVIPPRATITWLWALYPLVFVLQSMFNAGLVFYAARITSAIPDARLLFGFITRFWMYGSGVMFALDRFINHPRLLTVLELNPLYCVLELSRDLLVYGKVPDPKLWITLTLWAVLTPLIGFLYFWQGEEEYGRE
ncbi:MAG TPA: ABC transporter permease [Intrasporangium sp.]|uniref:ABC transporter permease n=1 Tax=Intrasporangium sp. TaxID=1925024 RepID=UPI002D76D5E9|nr:ABC transporter permease [Intrasporangium sp.]HET7397094.1 ABC transporter permease [Intrasporangium sp.]